MATFNTEIYVAIKKGSDLYYLLKVVRRGFDVYCFPPHLGVHYSVHESGQSHYTPDRIPEESTEEPPVALVPGEAGVFIGSGEISRTSLADDLGLAQGICSALYPIDFLKDDFGKFNRNPKELFVIDKEQFAKDTKCLNVGVWAVPNRNKQSFEYYNPGIPADLVYKVDRVEPQIWICAEPF